MERIMTDDMIEWAWDIYCSSYTVPEIAEALGVSKETVRHHFVKKFGALPSMREKKKLVYKKGAKE